MIFSIKWVSDKYEKWFKEQLYLKKFQLVEPNGFKTNIFWSNSLWIAAPPHNIQIIPSISGEGDKYLNISCSVTGVYPLPVIDLSWTNK